MSATHNDGGPAFPSVLYSHERAENSSTDGMSLRDWFAGQALAGVSSELVRMGSESGESAEATAAGLTAVALGVAGIAYELADAMLAARKAGAA